MVTGSYLSVWRLVYRTAAFVGAFRPSHIYHRSSNFRLSISGPPSIFLPTTSPPTKDPGPQSSVATHKTLLKMAFCILNGFNLGRSREAVFFLHRKITALVASGPLTHYPAYNPQFCDQVCGNS
jgi:hypothetical protein